MILPFGPWTTGPIELGTNPDDTARTILARLAPQPATSIPASALPGTARRRSSGRTLAIGGAVLAILLVLTGVLVLHRAPSTTVPGHHTYSAAVPGRGCDSGDAYWTQSSALAVTCQSNGALLSMPSDDGFYHSLSFEPPDRTIPTSYRIAVHAMIVSGDGQATARFAFHVQKPYGDQAFEVRANSRWNVTRIDTPNHFDRYLSLGFLPQQMRDFTMAVEVDGAVMHFSVNGTEVATVTDATYLTTAAIYISIGDPGYKQPFSVRFSDFTYDELPDPSLSTADAVATATAITQQRDKAPYRAAIPGFGCDHGGAQWSPISYSGDGATTATCTSQGLRLDHTSQTGLLGEVYFYWWDGNFPQNYSVGTTLTLLSQDTYHCGKIVTRQNNYEGYTFRLCTGGYWAISKYDAMGHPTELQSGYVTLHAHDTLLVRDVGAQQQFTIDGKVAGSITDGDYRTTDRIALAIDTGTRGSGIGSLLFSNFVFTPLP